MVTIADLHAIVRSLAFRDWEFELIWEEGIPFMRVSFDAPCSVTGEDAEQKGRKWRLSHHMTRSEVVSTALKAVLTAVEHEAREDFLYRDAAVFGPHVDVEALREMALRGAVDARG